MIDHHGLKFDNLLTIDYSTLGSICSFVSERLSRNRTERIKINEYREHLNYATQKFEVCLSVKFEQDIFG